MNRRHHHRKEMCIPLTSDTEFFALLANAIIQLEALELQQKETFTEDIQDLASEVSRVSSPMRSKKDLYAWRSLFALWVEAQIFEGNVERDRGEHSIAQVETRLAWFVDQVGRNKLATQMKHKDSRSVMEKFVALNVKLLDLKRFQIANEEAARKILKVSTFYLPIFCLSFILSD